MAPIGGVLQWDCMASARVKRPIRKKKSTFISPVDTSIFPSIISFSSVRGVSRIFLGFEMLLAACIVVGTFCLVVLHCLGAK